MRLENAPFAVYSHLLTGDPDPVEQKVRARRMGYEIDGNRLVSNDGSVFKYDPESITAQLAREGRDTARMLGGLGGGVAGSPGGPGGVLVGGGSGAMIAGSGYDLAMEAMHPSGQPLNENVSQLRGDITEELLAGAGGEAVSPFGS